MAALRREGDHYELAPTWESLVERKIREAQEQGLFDQLPGAGQPLAIESNPFAGEWALAYKLLKDAGFAPPWIELQGEIEREAAAAADEVVAARRAGAPDRERAWQRYAQRLSRLNHEIERFNALVPFVWLQKLPLDERALRRRFAQLWER